MPDKRLLLVTDHVYFRHNGEIYDNFGFNYEFFRSYLNVFDRVDVLCRMRDADNAEGLVLSSGEGLHFHGTPDIHGMSWFLSSLKYFKPYKSLIEECDAICYRIPATACHNVHVINQSLDSPKPHMFEFIGDPMDALFSINDSPLKRWIMTQVGKVHSKRMKAISDTAVSGSYVSREHLQLKFPPPQGVETEAISSIRLNEGFIRQDEKPLRDDDKVRIVEVASFVRQKNQTYLIEILKELRDKGVNAEVQFVGTGPEQEMVREKVNRLDLNEHVVFHNQVTGFDKVVAILDSCDIFCLPSFSEGVPRSMIEAMARGLVCVGTPIGGILELIPQEFTFPIGEPKTAADLVAGLVERKSEWPKIGKRNTETASEYGNSILVPRRKKVFELLKSHT